ncbi:MAG: response regulator [Planctomycetota bacterium]
MTDTSQTASKTVLVVDDDPDFLAQTRLQLEGAGYQVATAESRQQAEEALDAARPDAAVIDLMMEDSDAGFTLAYRIKKLDPAIPVIMVTAVTHETGFEFDAATDEERAWVKADAVLDKPVRVEQLIGEIERTR